MAHSLISRRSLLAGAAGGSFLAVNGARAAGQPIEMQLGWIGGGNQLGEVVGIQLGYFGEEGLDLKIVPGGPNNDGVAGVASGRSAIGSTAVSVATLTTIAEKFSLSNGRTPVRHSYSTTPNAYTSERASASLPCSCSSDM